MESMEEDAIAALFMMGVRKRREGGREGGMLYETCPYFIFF